MSKIKKWEYGLIAGIIILLSGIAYAQYAYESITVSTAVKSLTAATYGRATKAFITCETAAIRYTVDGVTVPNSGGLVGHKFPPTDGVVLMLENADEIRNFRAVRATDVDAVIKVTYFSR